MTPASTSQYTHGVDYHATSERSHYEELSPALRQAAGVALGSPVAQAAAPVTSGFTRAYAGRVLRSRGLTTRSPWYALPARASRPYRRRPWTGLLPAALLTTCSRTKSCRRR